METVFEADHGEFPACNPPGVVVSAKVEGGRDVFQRCHGRDQVEGLEHKPDMVAAKERQTVFVQGGQVVSENLNSTGTGLLEASKQHEE